MGTMPRGAPPGSGRLEVARAARARLKQQEAAERQATGMKPCARCGDPKPLGEFSPQPSAASGLHSYCKECRGVYARQRRARLLAGQQAADARVEQDRVRREAEQQAAEADRERRRRLAAIRTLPKLTGRGLVLRDAACEGVDVNLFFEPASKRQAVAICATCPEKTRAACLDAARRNDEWGVWGGMTRADRKQGRPRPAGYR